LEIEQFLSSDIEQIVERTKRILEILPQPDLELQPFQVDAKSLLSFIKDPNSIIPQSKLSPHYTPEVA
jgi:hypothetical protein